MIIGSINSEIIKILFDTNKENLFLGDTIKVVNKDNAGIVAQVMQIDSSKEKPSCNVAGCKILFTILPDNKLINWRGNVPSKDNTVTILSDKEILAYTGLNKEKNLSIGELTLYQGERFNIDLEALENSTLILCDKQDQRINFINLLSNEIRKNNEKVILFDFRGEYSEMSNVVIVTAGKDFCLPLDSNGIEVLYERTLQNTSAETKAVIEDIFMSIQEYADISEEGFIPFSSFKQVVEDEYDQSNIPELVLLKNKLVKLSKEGIFADARHEIDAPFSSMEENNLVIIDLSQISSLWHKEFIDFIVSSNINTCNQSFILMFELIDKNVDEDLINKIYVSGIKSGIKPLISVGYGSKYAGNLLAVSKNLIFFSPKYETDKFPEYRNFINRLNQTEVLVKGQITRQIPLFVQVDQFNPDQDDFIETEVEDSSLYLDYLEEETNEEAEEENIVEDDQDIEKIPQSEEFSEDDFYDNYEEYTEPEIVEEVPAYDLTEELIQQIDDVDALYTSKKPEEEILLEVEDDFKANIPVMSTPDIPIYPSDEPEPKEFDLNEGDTVKHQKYGEGVIKKIIGYGNKKLCSIEFNNVGRRLLDPSLAVIEKV
jgi:hypothetical protein